MNKINYAEIAVKSQEELDMIPDDYAGIIFIWFGDLLSPAIVEKSYKGPVAARGFSHVRARGNSSVRAYDHSSVEAYDHSSVEACDYSHVTAWDNSTVVALGFSSVEVWDNSSVNTRSKNCVVSRGCGFVGADDPWIGGDHRA